MSAGHDHSHAPANFNAAFGIGIALNLAFVGVEAFYGWKVDSMVFLPFPKPCAALALPKDGTNISGASPKATAP